LLSTSSTNRASQPMSDFSRRAGFYSHFTDPSLRQTCKCPHKDESSACSALERWRHGLHVGSITTAFQSYASTSMATCRNPPFSLRAYPKTRAARSVIQAQAKCGGVPRGLPCSPLLYRVIPAVRPLFRSPKAGPPSYGRAEILLLPEPPLR
jgi:hypothetical protein